MSTHFHLNLILISPSCVEVFYLHGASRPINSFAFTQASSEKESPLTVFSWPATEKHFQRITSFFFTAVWYLTWLSRFKVFPPVHVCTFLFHIWDGELPLSYRANNHIQRPYSSLIKGANKSGSTTRSNEGDDDNDEQTSAEDLSTVSVIFNWFVDKLVRIVH